MKRRQSFFSSNRSNRTPVSPIKRYLFVVLAMAVSLLFLAGCTNGRASEQKAGGVGQRPPASVTGANAGTKDVPPYLDQVARSVAPGSVNVHTQVSLGVKAIHFHYPGVPEKR